MIISKGASLLKVISKAQALKNVRNMSGHAYVYRAGAPPHSKATLITAEVAAAAMWWWILWHLWHEHEHITGEFPYPDPKQWTDAELGIPSE